MYRTERYYILVSYDQAQTIEQAVSAEIAASYKRFYVDPNKRIIKFEINTSNTEDKILYFIYLSGEGVKFDHRSLASHLKVKFNVENIKARLSPRGCNDIHTLNKVLKIDNSNYKCLISTVNRKKRVKKQKTVFKKIEETQDIQTTDSITDTLITKTFNDKLKIINEKIESFREKSKRAETQKQLKHVYKGYAKYLKMLIDTYKENDMNVPRKVTNEYNKFYKLYKSTVDNENV